MMKVVACFVLLCTIPLNVASFVLFFPSSLLIVQMQSLVHGFLGFFGFFFEVVSLRIMNASSSWRSIRSVSRWGLLKDSARSWAVFVCVYAIIDRGRNKRHWTTYCVFSNKSLLKSTTHNHGFRVIVSNWITQRWTGMGSWMLDVCKQTISVFTV